MFNKNFHNLPPIYLTYNAEKVEIPEKPITIKYGNTTEETSPFNKKKLRNQSCLSYVSQQDLNTIDEYKNAEWHDTNTLYDSEYSINEETFLDITGKQYDELVFSNMIFYFFEKDASLFKNLCEYIANSNDKFQCKLLKIKCESTYELKREVAIKNGRIDILVLTDNSLVVIENKVKSDIHGEKYNTYTKEYTNQLITYYEYINNQNDNDSEFSTLYKNQLNNQVYLIFTPKYNKINKTELKNKINKSDPNYEQKCKIIDNYIVVTYEDLFNFLETQQEYRNNLKEKQRFYFDEFKNALKKHSKDYDNTTEQEMEYRFRQAIERTPNS